jgi:glycosyltransferase involved in cell wall biosynthesis
MKGDGQGRVNYEVTWEAIRRGHQVTLLASHISSELQNHPQVEWITIPGQGIPTDLLGNLVFSYHSTHWLNRHRQEFDVIQVNGAITGAAADVNAVHFVHGSWVRSPMHPSRQHANLYGLYQWLYSHLNADWERQAFQRSQRIIAVSEKVKQELADLGVIKDRVQVIFNGVDLQEFYPATQPPNRRPWNLPQDVPLALFTGEIRSNRKNLDTVLQALLHVPALHLAVAGNATESPYPQLAMALGLANRVHFVGYRRDIPDLMRTVDFFVFPSHYEACTLALLEAMASGLPVVTAVTTGGSEIVTPDCGMVLPDSRDLDGLVATLSLLTQDGALRQRLGKRARVIAEAHSWQQMASQYLDGFEAMVQETRPLLC